MSAPEYDDLVRENAALAGKLIAAIEEANRWRSEAEILRARLNAPKPRDPKATSAFLRPFRG